MCISFSRKSLGPAQEPVLTVNVGNGVYGPVRQRTILGMGAPLKKKMVAGVGSGGDGNDATLLPFATLQLPVMGAGSCRSCWENASLSTNGSGACWFVLPGHLILSPFVS